MRRFVTFSVSILASIAMASAAIAEGAPDLTALGCAWSKLPEAEQARLRDDFKVDLHDGGFALLFGTANPGATADSARQCQLNLTPPQTEDLALGLARHAAEEKAKLGIAERSEKPESIQTALAKMHEGKRETIGDKLSCPGAHPMVKEWDSSVGGAIGKARLNFQNTRAYSWVSLGMYAVMAQEGVMRRIAGKSGGCS